MFDLFVAESNNNLEIKSVPGICLCTPELLLHELEVGYELQYKVPFQSLPCYILNFPKQSICQVLIYH